MRACTLSLRFRQAWHDWGMRFRVRFTRSEDGKDVPDCIWAFGSLVGGIGVSCSERIRNFGRDTWWPYLSYINIYVPTATYFYWHFTPEIIDSSPDSGEHENHSQPWREISSFVIDQNSRLIDSRPKKRFVTLHWNDCMPRHKRLPQNKSRHCNIQSKRDNPQQSNENRYRYKSKLT